MELRRVHDVRVKLRTISMGGQFLAVSMDLAISAQTIEKQLGLTKKRRVYSQEEKEKVVEACKKSALSKTQAAKAVAEVAGQQRDGMPPYSLPGQAAYYRQGSTTGGGLT